jgi:hypothetical protein
MNRAVLKAIFIADTHLLDQWKDAAVRQIEKVQSCI